MQHVADGRSHTKAEEVRLHNYEEGLQEVYIQKHRVPVTSASKPSFSARFVWLAGAFGAPSRSTAYLYHVRHPYSKTLRPSF
jgi:hypothetical protein